ncbi:hypothetical protein HJFPF1_13441 [Paramyrothecium foliicola]|nr:hypothetical protein HJFPF1_13441 [Paramyrothecium foliicola]
MILPSSLTSHITSGTPPVVLILGAGPKVGLPAARAFASKGYKVAIAAKSLEEADSTDGLLNIKSDFDDSKEVVDAFKKVKKELGIPSVVVYNAALGSAELPAHVSRTFFLTGNIFNVAPLPQFLESNADKSASAHMMSAAAEYKEKGFKYAKTPIYTLTTASMVDGDAHARLFLELTGSETHGPWLQTFVKGEGYKDFGPYRL